MAPASWPLAPGPWLLVPGACLVVSEPRLLAPNSVCHTASALLCGCFVYARPAGQGASLQLAEELVTWDQHKEATRWLHHVQCLTHTVKGQEMESINQEI